MSFRRRLWWSDVLQLATIIDDRQISNMHRICKLYVRLIMTMSQWLLIIFRYTQNSTAFSPIQREKRTKEKVKNHINLLVLICHLTRSGNWRYVFSAANQRILLGEIHKSLSRKTTTTTTQPNQRQCWVEIYCFLFLCAFELRQSARKKNSFLYPHIGGIHVCAAPLAFDSKKRQP